MEENGGDRPVLQEWQSLELERALAGGQLDVASLRSLERAHRYAAEEIDGARQARAQLLDGSLGVLEARRLLAVTPRHGTLGDVTCDLHLAGERQHVRREARREQHARIELALRSAVRSLL